MIAIFYTEKEAVEFSNKIHSWLLKNRSGYNAERWSFTNKSEKEDKWMVKLPGDYPMLNENLVKEEQLNIPLSAKEQVLKIPEDWRAGK